MGAAISIIITLLAAGTMSGRGFRGSGRGRYPRGPGRGRGGRFHGRGPPRQGPFGRNDPGGGRDEPPFHGMDDPIEEIGSPTDQSISIAIEGCCHGELDAIYARLQRHEEQSGRKIDLLLCCGDFQSLRNTADFHSLAVPPKYRALGSFYRYYSGEKTAPILTLFVGGNHEASQPLHELYYGGWVAPNIYYLGAAGVVNFQGIRIGGISGIYKSHDYEKGRDERPPYDRSSLRSVYHVRKTDVYRLKCLSDSRRLDVIISHDWPQGIEQHGDTDALLRKKPFFRQEVQQNSLGSPPNRELLDVLQPRFWFAAHLHVRFSATVSHDVHKEQSTTDGPSSLVPSSVINSKTTQKVQKKEEKGALDTDRKITTADTNTTQFHATESTDPCLDMDLTEQMTRFLSLDKCLPRRQYLSVLHLPVNDRKSDSMLEYDPEWLAILRKTHDLSFVSRGPASVPVQPQYVTSEEVDWVKRRLGKSLVIPENFSQTVQPHLGPPFTSPLPPPFPMMGNPQTDTLLQLLELQHIVTIPFSQTSTGVPADQAVDENEIEIDGVDAVPTTDGDIDVQPLKDDNEIELGDGDHPRDGNELDLDEKKVGQDAPKKPRTE